MERGWAGQKIWERKQIKKNNKAMKKLKKRNYEEYAKLKRKFKMWEEFSWK